MVFYILTAIISYLLGSINTALILGKFVFKDDARNHGSGNLGTTNALRAFGWKGAALTLAGDIIKTAVAVLLTHFFAKRYGITEPDPRLIAGLFAILGHNFPFYCRFKGGKGAASTLAVLLLLDWRVGLVIFAVGLPILLMTRYVSLAVLAAATVYPFVTYLFDRSNTYLVLYTSVASLLIVWTHRTNINRLANGTESKIKFK